MGNHWTFFGAGLSAMGFLLEFLGFLFWAASSTMWWIGDDGKFFFFFFPLLFSRCVPGAPVESN
jgi:hypothetical protein